jgi:hypothetical protein
MRYWWHAKKFGGDVLILTPEEAAVGMRAKKSGESFEIPRLRAQIDSKAIAEFEESRDVFYESSSQLGSGLEDGPKIDRALHGVDGGILTHWVKKFVKDREYNARDSYYKNGSGYWPLRRLEDQSGLFIVFSRPVYASGLPEGLEELEDWETQMMEKRLADSPGWWNAVNNVKENV